MYDVCQTGVPARCDEDVMLLHYALCETKGTHDLKQLAADQLGATDYDTAVHDWLNAEKKRRLKALYKVKSFKKHQVTATKNMVKRAWSNAAKAKAKAEKDLANTVKYIYSRRLMKTKGFEGPFIEESQSIGPIEDFLVYDLSCLSDEEVEMPVFEPLEGYAQVPPEILLPYLAMDCDYTWQLFEEFRHEVATKPGLEQLYTETLMGASKFLQRIEDRGIFVDLQHLQKLKVELGARKDAAEQTVAQAVAPLWSHEVYRKQTGAKTAPATFNVASTKQLHWLIFNCLGIRLPPGVKKTTNRAVIELIKDRSPIFPLLLEYRRVAKMLSTYVIAVENRLDSNGRVHSTYKIIGAETGRLSSASPNLQNIPTDTSIKNLFAAPPGYVLVEVDQSQAELRVAAALSGDKALTEIYQKGLDLHTEVTIAIYGDEFLKCTNEELRTRMRRDAKCMTPDTRILRGDLRWVPLSEIKDGDEIVACDEESTKQGQGRRLRKGKVVSAWRAMKELYEVEFVDGTVLKMTDDHPMLTRRFSNNTSKLVWRTLYDGLKQGFRVMDVWSEDTSKDAGWLAGYFDGEGCVSSTNGRGCYQIGAPQSVGPTSERVERLLLERGFQASRRPRVNNVNPCYPERETQASEMTLVTGGIAERMRFLGSIRPERLISNAMKFEQFGELRGQGVEIVRITPIGVGEVISLETDTHTFIAEGFVTHNTINFGILFGMTAKLLSSRLSITFDEAQRMIDIWFERFPDVKRFLDHCRSLPAKGRYLETVFGRRRRFPLITQESLHKLQNEAGNFPIQSTASDLTLMAGMSIDQELEAMGALIVNIVHDSLLIQVPDNATTIYNVVNIARNAMIQTAIDYLGNDVPFDADAKVGMSWGDCYKYKLELPAALRKAS